MPIHKTSLYDATVILEGSGSLDLRGVAAKVGVLANGATSRGSKTIVVDGTDASGFDVGDKLISGLTGKALGVVKTATEFLITLERGCLQAVENNDSIELAPKFEIVGIMPLGSTDSNVNASDTEITSLIPCSTAYFGTHAPNAGTWTAHDDHITRFGAGAETGDDLSASYNFPSGTLIEGRWKKITLSATGTAVVYLKAASSQTF